MLKIVQALRLRGAAPRREIFGFHSPVQTRLFRRVSFLSTTWQYSSAEMDSSAGASSMGLGTLEAAVKTDIRSCASSARMQPAATHISMCSDGVANYEIVLTSQLSHARQTHYVYSSIRLAAAFRVQNLHRKTIVPFALILMAGAISTCCQGPPASRLVALRHRCAYCKD